MRKQITLIPIELVTALILTSCGRGLFLSPTQTLTPTVTSTSTLTSTSTATVTRTRTPTLTPTVTATSTQTDTPLPGLGVTPSDISVSFSDVDFRFSRIPNIHGMRAQKGTSTDGYMTITLIGEPYLSEAILQIDMLHENGFIATAVWILFLSEAAPQSGKDGADWVHNNYSKALETGSVQTTFGNAKIILESTGSLGEQFHMIIQSLDYAY